MTTKENSQNAIVKFCHQTHITQTKQIISKTTARPGLRVTAIANNTHEKLLGSDWLRAVQFKFNTSAKTATPVQKV